jgi:hypothetical protein
VPLPRPVVRALTGFGLLCSLVVALAGGVVLHGSIVLVVWVAAGLTACVAYGMRDDGRAAAAWTAGAWTAAVIMLATGAGVLAGGVVSALVVAVALVHGAVWAWQGLRAAPAVPAGRPLESVPPPLAPAVRLARAEVPVSLLPTSVLGSEWLRTTAALGARLDAAERQEILRRRQETLDELERRDPAGFARWLAGWPSPQSDPAAFVRGHRTMGSDAP